MRKSISILALCATVFLTWCGSSWQNMTFSQAYEKMREAPIHLLATQNKDTVDAEKPLADNTIIAFHMSAPQWFLLSGDIIISGQYDAVAGNAHLGIDINGKAFEPSFGASVWFHGALAFLQEKAKTYGIINAFTIAPETGNIDGWLITALIGSISNTRIDLSPDALSSSSLSSQNIGSYQAKLHAFLATIGTSLKKYPLFKEQEKTKIQGKLAYKIWWNEEGLSGFLTELLHETHKESNDVSFSTEMIASLVSEIVHSPIAWYLLVENKNTVSLHIDSIQTKDSGIISLSYSPKDWCIRENMDEQQQTIATGSVSAKKESVDYTLSIPLNNTHVTGKRLQKDKKMFITLLTPDLTVDATVYHTVQNTAPFVLPVVSGALNIQDIMSWFSLLGGAPDEVHTESEDAGNTEKNTEDE